MIEDLFFLGGRLHPLVVHLPIGIALLMALTEAVIGWRTASEESHAWRTVMAWALAVSAVLAAGFGWLLALDGGYDDALLWNHRWTGVLTAALACLLLLLRHHLALYRVTLVLLVAMVMVAGHFGGSLTHGSNYLQLALARFLEPDNAPENPGAQAAVPPTPEDMLVFNQAIQPVFDAYCTACHGPDKQRGGLRLDSWEAVLAGGKSGPVLVVGEPSRSELVRRLYLPPEDEHRMPPEGKPQPERYEIRLLEWWIRSGAPADATLAELPPPAPIREALYPRLGLEAGPAAPALPDRAAVLAAAPAFEYATGALVHAMHPTEPWVEVVARLQGEAFDDDDLAAIAPLAPAVDTLDLSGTAVTDDGLAALREMSFLRRLDLSRTAVSDTGLRHLTGLDRLESLNLYGTDVSDTGIAAVAGLLRLRRVYLWKTDVSPEAANALRAELTDSLEIQRIEQEIRDLQNQLADEQVEIEAGGYQAPDIEPQTLKDGE